MSLRRRVLLSVSSALALTTATVSLLALIALNAGEARLGPAVLMRFAAACDRRAQALLAGPGAPSPAAAREAAALSRAAIAQYPYDTAAWLQLAYLDAARHGGRVSAEGVADLQRSYDLVAADPDVGLWRLRFALENWVWLSFEARTAAEAEAALLMTSHRPALRRMQAEIRDPIGRLTLGIWLKRLQPPQAK